MALQWHTLHKFEHNLCIIKINECLVAKNLLMNVTKTNEHSNVTTFVHALVRVHVYLNLCVCMCMCLCIRLYVCTCMCMREGERE